MWCSVRNYRKGEIEMADQNVNEDVRLEENQPKPLTRDEVVHALTAAGHLLASSSHALMCGMDAATPFYLAKDVLNVIAQQSDIDRMLEQRKLFDFKG